ncbi:restriction endonuclease subunit S [Blautia coccoides]|uniref:restriction endonuclease subunit S n=1 Tax=Blautia producta TaxID=33035 RepID=UPI0028A466F8|nr:restriction endonuclease subunit S [Blautia coccoides]MDT4377140.1 restriction endonuclease subunit S [Blautia coccoides]
MLAFSNNNYELDFGAKQSVELFCAYDTSEKEQETYSIKENDILITRTSETIDELAMSCVAVKDYPNATYSGFTKRLRPKTDGIAYAKYLAFYLRGYLFRKSVTNNAFMTLRASFNEDIFSFLNLYLPEYPQQVLMGNLLYNIEHKIQVNKKINENLEQQAKALYQQMFIENTCPDWIEGSLRDIADITMGQSPSGSSFNEDGIGTIFFQGRAEFSFRFPTIRLYTTEPKRMAYANDILMSVRAPVGDLNIAHTDCCIGRGLAAIHSKTNHQSFVLYTMFSLRKQLDVFNGEGTVFGSINRNSLNDMPILIPSDETIEEFEKIVAPMDAAIRNNYDEICRLQAVRDSLLPRLMSGELDVSSLDI